MPSQVAEGMWVSDREPEAAELLQRVLQHMRRALEPKYGQVSGAGRMFGAHD